jgi:sulfite oxidase
MDRGKERRLFLKKAGVSVLGAAVFGHPSDLSQVKKTDPVSVVGEKDALKGKHPDLIIQGEKPWNVESQAHLLDDDVTPFDKMFIRNNGLVPETVDVESWTLTINGESVVKSKTYTLSDLKKKFPHHTYQLVLECGGNGRSGFSPPTSGNQWGQGAVHCARWTGVRLKDLLQDVGLKGDAVYIGFYGKDKHLSGAPSKSAISRGVPMAKALEDETLVAWEVNGEAIPEFHGFPLRLVVGGWPASVSGKWLHTISVRNKVHDGAKMEGHSYKVPRFPVQPGEDLPANDQNYRIIGSMPVKSLITYPKSGAVIEEGDSLELRGHAWAGDLKVKEVHVSIDYGATWSLCQVNPPANRLAWQRWTTQQKFPTKGYYEVWVRATDENGISQPMLAPAWNPGGYLNNSCERIAVKVV